MSKVIALALTGAFLLSTAPARAAETDRALLSTFCDAANIKGSTCKRAKGYPNAGKRACDVTLTADRYGGKFIASGSPLLVVNYESGCEAHTTDNGGTVVFEQTGGKYAFRSFQPGTQGSECITLPKDEQQDLLICITGHMGQGIEARQTHDRSRDPQGRSPELAPERKLSAGRALRRRVGSSR